MKNILWVPLDLPLPPKEITLENIKQFFDYIPNASTTEREQYSQQKQHYKYAWNTFRLRAVSTVQGSWETQNDTSEWEWTAGALAHCPGLVDYINTYLPFKKIKAASIMSSTGVVPLHLDMHIDAPLSEKQNYLDNEPSVYRLLIDGEMHTNSFYVASPTVGKIYTTLPETSPGWAMGCYSCGHGNDEETPHQKILLYIMGDLDPIRHKELVERSLVKYKEYAVLSS